jgi:Fe2+ transport system protein B
MTPDEYTKLQEQLQLERDKNIDLKFQNLNQKMDEVIALLKDNVKKNDQNKDSIKELEIKVQNCPIGVVKAELKRYGKETNFLRALFKNAIVGTFVITLWIVFIFGLLITFGPDSLVEFLMKFKGL